MGTRTRSPAQLAVTELMFADACAIAATSWEHKADSGYMSISGISVGAQC